MCETHTNLYELNGRNNNNNKDDNFKCYLYGIASLVSSTLVSTDKFMPSDTILLQFSICTKTTNTLYLC